MERVIFALDMVDNGIPATNGDIAFVKEDGSYFDTVATDAGANPMLEQRIASIQYKRDGKVLSVPYYPQNMTVYNSVNLPIQPKMVATSSALHELTPTAGDILRVTIVRKGFANELPRNTFVVEQVSVGTIATDLEALDDKIASLDIVSTCAYASNVLTITFVDDIDASVTYSGGLSTATVEYTTVPITTSTLAAGNTFGLVDHGIENGTELICVTAASSTITAGNTYYVVNSAIDTFQVADTVGGAAKTFDGNAVEVTFSKPWTGNTATSIGLTETNTDSHIGNQNFNYKTSQFWSLGSGYDASATSCFVIRSHAPTDKPLSTDNYLMQEIIIYYKYDAEVITNVTLHEVLASCLTNTAITV